VAVDAATIGAGVAKAGVAVPGAAAFIATRIASQPLPSSKVQTELTAPINANLKVGIGGSSEGADGP
jgi:hypothetical protein